MAKIGTLVADLRLESASFQRDMRAATQSLNTNTAQMRKHMRNLERSFNNAQRTVANFRNAIGALAGALAIREITQMSRAAVENTLAIRDMAAGLGLTVQHFQETQFAFARFGLQADNVSDAMGTLADRAQDAIAGTQSMVDDFALLGVSVDDLRGKRPAELFALVAQRVSEVEDPTARAAGVLRTFGDDLGRKVMPLLMQGEAGLAAFARQAREFGVVMGSDVARAAAEAGATMRTLEMVGRSAFDRSLVEAFAGSVSLTAENLRQAQMAGENFGHAVGTAMSGIVPIAEFLAEHVSRFVEDLRAASIETQGIIAAVQQLASFNLTGAMEARRTSLQAADESRVGLDAFGGLGGGLTEGLAPTIEMANAYSEAIGKAKTETEAFHKSNAEASKALQNNFGSSLQSSIGMVQGFTGVLAQESDTWFEINKAAAIANTLVSTYAGAMKAYEQLGAFGAPMAALITATGLANVALIASQKPGGGSRSAAMSGSVPTGNAGTAGAAAATQGTTHAFNITLQGDKFNQDDIRSLFEQINQGLSDGHKIRFRTT